MKSAYIFIFPISKQVSVCWFLIAAITNYHKLSGLKQPTFITSQCWRSSDLKWILLSQDQYVGWAMLPRDSRKESAFLHFSASRLDLHSMAGVLFLHLRSQQHSIFKLLFDFHPLLPLSHLLILTILLSSYKNICAYTGPTEITQNNVLPQHH